MHKLCFGAPDNFIIILLDCGVQMVSTDSFVVLAGIKDALQQHNPVSSSETIEKYKKEKRGVKGIWDKSLDWLHYSKMS